MSRKSGAKNDRPASLVSVFRTGSQAWAWILLAAIVVFIAIIRVRLLQVPLERDEGEFGYMGQLILQGIPPYKIACNMKLPGTYLMYAFFMKLFGQTTTGVHLGLLVMNAISTTLVFSLARRILGPLAAVVAGFSFGLLSLSPSVLGTAAHATQFVLPFALGGVLLMLKAADSHKTGMLIISGLLLGLAFLMKQHAIFFAPFALLYVWWHWMDGKCGANGRVWLRLLFFGAVMTLPYALTCLILARVGVFQKFWFWTYTYSKLYISQADPSIGWSLFRTEIARATRHCALLWIMGGVGLTAPIWWQKARDQRVFLIGLAVFSFLTVCPGMYFRVHYFITFLPALAILIGAAVGGLVDVLRNVRWAKTLPLILFAVIMGNSILVEREFLFRATPNEVSKMLYGSDLFIAMANMGKYIKAHTTSRDKVVVFGSEPEIYFYSQRRSGTQFIYTYSLMDDQEYSSEMQNAMVQEIVDSKPEFILVCNVVTSWLPGPGSDLSVFEWGARYFAEHYSAIGIVEFVDPDHTAYSWNVGNSYEPKASQYVTLLRRTQNSPP